MLLCPRAAATLPQELFSEVHTNPAAFEAGALRVRPYHTGHGCHRCPINLCKGQVCYVGRHSAVAAVSPALCPPGPARRSDHKPSHPPARLAFPPQVLWRFLAQRAQRGSSYDRVLYVGDGRGDWCPTVELLESGPPSVGWAGLPLSGAAALRGGCSWA